jgi:hypothetical protein
MIAGEQSDERHDAHYSNYYRSLTHYHRTLAPHDSGAEIRNSQKVGVAKCIQKRQAVAVACPHRLQLSLHDFQTQLGYVILLLEVTPAPKGQDNFISARLGST